MLANNDSLQNCGNQWNYKQSHWNTENIELHILGVSIASYKLPLDQLILPRNKPDKLLWLPYNVCTGYICFANLPKYYIALAISHENFAIETLYWWKALCSDEKHSVWWPLQEFWVGGGRFKPHPKPNARPVPLASMYRTSVAAPSPNYILAFLITMFDVLTPYTCS